MIPRYFTGNHGFLLPYYTPFRPRCQQLSPNSPFFRFNFIADPHNCVLAAAGHGSKLLDTADTFRYNMLMFKIWAKVMEGDHIAKQTVYESDNVFTYSQFFVYLTDICDALDVPTPVLLKPHLFQYAKFRRITFRPADFMEDTPFDKLVLENIG